MNELSIQDFWQTHPCGEGLVEERFDEDFSKFFNSYDAMRYTKEKHILECLAAIDFKGKNTLEIGLGQGADAEVIARAGAIYNGLDLTAAAVDRVKTRFRIKKLSYDKVVQGSALEIPFPDNSFDIVFSHGVLHHIPNIGQAQKEIERVLKPNGELIVMLYARHSFNYWFSIKALRKLLLVPMYLFNFAPSAMLRDHVDNAKRLGLWNYLSDDHFIHANTDGPRNPFSRVYDLPLVNQHFDKFTVSKSYKRFMYAPPLPVSWMPFEKLMGWHLWVHMRKKPAPKTNSGSTKF